MGILRDIKGLWSCGHAEIKSFGASEKLELFILFRGNTLD